MCIFWFHIWSQQKFHGCSNSELRFVPQIWRLPKNITLNALGFPSYFIWASMYSYCYRQCSHFTICQNSHCFVDIFIKGAAIKYNRVLTFPFSCPYDLCHSTQTQQLKGNEERKTFTIGLHFEMSRNRTPFSTIYCVHKKRRGGVAQRVCVFADGQQLQNHWSVKGLLTRQIRDSLWDQHSCRREYLLEDL